MSYDFFCCLIILLIQFEFFFCSDDLDRLQLARTPEMFNIAADLFLKKWIEVSPELVEYFEYEWLIQNRNWYEGYMHKTPSTNNALEAYNKVIKDEHTMRERLDISQFRVVLFNMIKQWSIEYAANLNAINDGAPAIELDLWTSGYNFARSNVQIKKKRNENEIVFTLMLEDVDVTTVIEDFSEWKSFSDYKHSLLCAHVKFQYPITTENWMFGSCDCKEGLKLFICQHIIGIAIRSKVATAPPEAKNIPIGQKRKRGRPAKAKRALLFQ